jgi:hypothetical protein
MKFLAALLIALSVLSALADEPMSLRDRLSPRIELRVGLESACFDVPSEVKYTPAHPDDSPAVYGGHHGNPDLMIGTMTLSAGLRLLLTRRFGIEGGVGWSRWDVSYREESRYPPYESFTYLDADLHETWISEPYIQAVWTYRPHKHGDGHLWLGLGLTRATDVEIEYKRGWYRYDSYQLDDVHRADIETRAAFLSFGFQGNGVGFVARIERRRWKAEFDTGHRSTDVGIGATFGMAFMF